MGIIYTVVTESIELAEKVKNDKRKDQFIAEEQQKDDIIKPVEPPKYYQTIAARKENVKEGPYTVEAIAESLNNGLVPVGYSLEQLKKVGFGANVREYERREKEEREDDRKNLVESLKKLKEEMINFVSEKDMSEKDKEIIKKYNILDSETRAKYIKLITRWIGLAEKDALSVDVLNDMINAFNLRIRDYNDSLKAEKLKKQHRKLVDDAVLSREKKILHSVKRAFRNGYLY